MNYRLIRYNAAKKENEVLMRNLAFANGIMLSDDESFVIVAETLINRIMKYNLKGPKAGQYEVFIDALPGMPDNINSDGQGGFLVCLILVHDPEYPDLIKSLMPHPYLRKMLVRLLVTMELPFKLLYDIYPNTYTERLLHAIGSFQGAESIIIMKEKSLVLRIDASGNIIDVLSADDGTIHRNSAVHIHNDYLWFGSPWVNYISRVPLKQAFPDLADSAKESSRTRNEKQSPNAGPSGVKIERTKRDTDSTRSTAAPTPAPTPTPKSTVVPKPSSASKADEPSATTNSNVKSSETKSSTNTEAKKNNAKTAGDTKPNTKSNSPNMKSEETSKKETAAKTQSGKNVKEQDASAKQTAQKSQAEKVKRVETNRLKEDL